MKGNDGHKAGLTPGSATASPGLPPISHTVGTGRAPITIGIVAGEASGDALAAALIEATRARFPHVRFAGIAGPRMEAAGCEAWYPLEKLAVRGFAEVIAHLPELFRIRGELRRRLLAERVPLFVGVDAPDFNLGLEEQLKARGIRTVQYVSPQVWAWRAHRIPQMRRSTDHVLCLFPFEAPFLEQHGVAASFVGHPLADQIPEIPNRDLAREQFRLTGVPNVIALLPGSRQSELEYMADLFVQTAQLIHRQLPAVHFLVPLQSRQTRLLFEQALHRHQAQDLQLTILFGHAQMAMTAADVVLLASGTATLEAALLKRSMVVTYRLSPATYAAIRRRGHRLPYVSLPNILAGRFVVPEILQDDATPEHLSQALLNQLADKLVRARQESVFLDLHRQLQQDTRVRLVEALLPLLGVGTMRGKGVNVDAAARASA
ncbi:MAG: lipid-A-disaccharide synthase [Burkholderiales bacterium]|nr:lipid-A-disaccharide synthase [Burkholderiales bacterium]